MKRESQDPNPNMVLRPSIKRHGTSIKLNENSVTTTSRQSDDQGLSRTHSHPILPIHESTAAGEEKCQMGDVCVELESCVSSMELIQLQLNKFCECVCVFESHLHVY